MWQIVVNGPGRMDTTYLMGPRSATIGRGKDNQIPLTGHPVSRRHGRLEVVEEILFYEDLGSRNGSRLNGHRVKSRVVLKAGDVLTVGDFSLSIRRLARLENLELSHPDLAAGGVRRFRSGDLRSRVLLTRAPRDRDLVEELDAIDASTLVDGGRPSLFSTLILHADAAEKVDSADRAQHFLEDLLGWVRARVDAHSAVIFLRHRDGLMVPVVTAVREGSPANIPVCDDVLAAALKKRSAIAVAAVREDSRSSVSHQVLCGSIGVEEAPLGAVYLNRPDREEEVAPYLDLCNAVGTIIERAIQRFLGHRQVAREQRVQQLLQRLYAPEIARAAREASVRAGVPPAQSLEERPVTVICAELTGFTSVVERFAPDRVAGLLNDFHDCVTGVLLSYDATIARLDGGRLLGFFGAPTAHEDDANRALRTALALRDEWGRVLRSRPPQERCGLQIGVHHGEALVGYVGTLATLEYTVMGEVVATARAVCEVAEAGQILITHRARRVARGRFEVAPVGEQALRGQSKTHALLSLMSEDVATSSTHRIPALTD